MTNAIKQFKDVELFKEISAIELERAIANMGGKESLYLSLITNFYNTQVNIKSTIDELYNAENWEQLYRVVHTLKTNTAYIGAFVLSEMCGQVETQLEDKDYSGTLITALAKQLGNLINDLTNCLPTDDQKEENHISKGALDTLLLTIRTLLSKSSLDVEARLPSLQAMAKNSSFEQDITKLVTLILNVEYEKALPLIDEILVKVNEQ